MAILHRKKRFFHRDYLIRKHQKRAKSFKVFPRLQNQEKKLSQAHQTFPSAHGNLSKLRLKSFKQTTAEYQHQNLNSNSNECSLVPQMALGNEDLVNLRKLSK